MKSTKYTPFESILIYASGQGWDLADLFQSLGWAMKHNRPVFLACMPYIHWFWDVSSGLANRYAEVAMGKPGALMSELIAAGIRGPVKPIHGDLPYGKQYHRVRKKLLKK